jgi:glycosyltransferase involved in cell wall biosynthesis
MSIALLTNYLTPYRVPLYQRLHERLGVEVVCYGGGDRYVPSWFADIDGQLEAAPFPARRLEGGARGAFALGGRHEAVIAPFAGGALLPAAYYGAHARRRPFVLWASVWAWPRSPGHLVAAPVTRRIFRKADAVLAYGAHVRRFVAGVRGRDSDVFVAPQSVEDGLFGAPVPPGRIAEFRTRHHLPEGPLVLYAGRLVPEKGVEVLLEAWRNVADGATLILVGDGPLAAEVSSGGAPGVRLLGPLPRESLPVAYAAASFAVLPSIPTPRFLEPWGLVCNEAMLGGRPMVASDAVGAVAGGLVRDDENGLVVPAGDVAALALAMGRLLSDDGLRGRLGAAARVAVAPYNYDAMVDAFEQALAVALA